MNNYRVQKVSKNSKKYKKNMKGGFELTREAGYTSAERQRLEQIKKAQEESTERIRRSQKLENIGLNLLRYLGIIFGLIFLIVSTVFSFNKENGFGEVYLSLYTFLGVLPYVANDIFLIKKGIEIGIKKSIIYATIIILAILILINLINASRFLSIYQNLENDKNTYGSRLIEIQKKKTVFIIGISLSCVFLLIALGLFYKTYKKK